MSLQRDFIHVPKARNEQIEPWESELQGADGSK